MDFSWSIWSKFGSFEVGGLQVGSVYADTLSFELETNAGLSGSVGDFGTGNWELCQMTLIVI